jgi:phage protein U
MFLTFGNITFQGIKLPQTWDSSYETNYGQIPIIVSKPVVQGTGEKLDEHDITAYFHADFCTPRTEVTALQTMRKAGTVAYLVDGTGKNYGRFVITTLQETKVTCLDNGYETSVTISLHLLEYNTNASYIKQTGKALSSQNPVKETAATPLVSPALEIHTSTKNALQTSASLQSKITANSTPTSGMYNTISTLATQAKAYFTEVNSLIAVTNKIIARVKTLQSSITSVNSNLDQIVTYASAGDYNNLSTANTNLSDSLDTFNSSYAPVAAFIGSREGGN